MRGLRERDGHQLLPLGRAAREIGLGPPVLYAARKRGELVTFDISGRSYITLTSAREWLLAHRRGGSGGER